VTNDKDDRDAAVDRLLAGTLAAEGAEPAGACLDADTLAAWADNTLNADELAAAEGHAADCARCQAMLAAMVRTAPAASDTAASPWFVPSLRWLIPLTAAAAVIVWIVVPLREMGPVNVRQVSQSAEPTGAPDATTAAADAVVPSAAGTADGRRRRDQETPGQENQVEADKKAAASAEAKAFADAPALSSDTLLDKVQVAPGPAARAFGFGAPEAVIVSSNPASRWRILPGGAVQRSADGGATWQTQSTGVGETLSSGSSPSPSVCWLVGPGGIVLLSTDGRSWKRVAFPEAVALATVRATDDQTAIVTTTDGREFVTEDGGRTWARAPGQ
jgi:hypothetical protein